MLREVQVPRLRFGDLPEVRLQVRVWLHLCLLPEVGAYPPASGPRSIVGPLAKPLKTWKFTQAECLTSVPHRLIIQNGYTFDFRRADVTWHLPCSPNSRRIIKFLVEVL